MLGAILSTAHTRPTNRTQGEPRRLLYVWCGPPWGWLWCVSLVYNGHNSALHPSWLSIMTCLTTAPLIHLRGEHSQQSISWRLEQEQAEQAWHWWLCWPCLSCSSWPPVDRLAFTFGSLVVNRCSYSYRDDRKSGRCSPGQLHRLNKFCGYRRRSRWGGLGDGDSAGSMNTRYVERVVEKKTLESDSSFTIAKTPLSPNDLELRHTTYFELLSTPFHVQRDPPDVTATWISYPIFSNAKGDIKPTIAPIADGAGDNADPEHPHSLRFRGCGDDHNHS